MTNDRPILLAVKAVRDCGVIRARGKAANRFAVAEQYGYLNSKFNVDRSSDFWLSPKGKRVVEAWLLSEGRV